MRTNTLIIVLTCLILGACANTNSHKGGHSYPNWKLVYQHDKEGTLISGNKQQLINLIQSGHSVRIVWALSENFVHITDAGFLTVMNGEVFAQAHDIIRQIPKRKPRLSIALDAKDQSHWHSIFSTTGEMQSFQSYQGQLNSHQAALKWYVMY